MSNISKISSAFQYTDTIQKFTDALRNAGLEPPTPIIADGNIHRFAFPDDKKGSKNGWYVLYPDFPPAGAFGCWKRQIKETFCPPLHDDYSVQLQQNRIVCLNQTIPPKVENKLFLDLWENASVATDRCHYLLSKRIKSHGLRYHQNALLVPVIDSDNNILGIQKIWPNGTKRFLSGTNKQGNFYLIGSIEQKGIVLIAEGYATAATLHEVTGYASVVAFDAGNLLPVAKNIQNAYPASNIIVCGDDDHNQLGNPGLTKASEAATAIDGVLAMPHFISVRGPNDTDFNDLYVLDGADAVINSLRIVGVV